jgi:hypothetical protein
MTISVDFFTNEAVEAFKEKYRTEGHSEAEHLYFWSERIANEIRKKCEPEARAIIANQKR